MLLKSGGDIGIKECSGRGWREKSNDRNDLSKEHQIAQRREKVWVEQAKHCNVE